MTSRPPLAEQLDLAPHPEGGGGLNRSAVRSTVLAL